MLGLCGSHRTGKTTLAQLFAERAKIPFVRTSATEVFAMIGKDPKVDYPIEERIAIQEAILYAFEKQYSAARSIAPVWISDRTPIDLASYMIADVQRGTFSLEPRLALMVNDYVKRCIDATNQWFATVVLVQPGIVMVEEEGKAPACPAYCEHLNLIQSGLLLNENLLARHYMIPRRYTNIEQRIESLGNAATHSIEAHQCMNKARESAGVFLH